jgi:hypothetical protein
VIRRRLVPLAVVVTALLAVVAIAARGRPLGKNGGSGGGLDGSFWDYAFTSFVILWLLLVFGAFAVLFFFRREILPKQGPRRRTFRAVMIVVIMGGLLALFGHYVNLHRLLHSNGNATPHAANGRGTNGAQNRFGTPRNHVRFRWDEAAIVLGLLLGLGAVALAMRPKRLGPATQRLAPEMLAAALDESLDDLRADEDLRRAIVAAYARMETTLAAAGIPRHHAEAPLEYMERALLTLEASAPAVRRLTDLFEWARFSHHEPEPAMRDEAVDALVAVRDELRASELVAT